MQAQPPSGTVTLLFTDIEGSTPLAQHYPAALPALLARHHAILHGADAHVEGNFSLARSILAESIALCRAIGARWELGIALLWYGAAARLQKDFDAARASLTEAGRWFSEVGDLNGVAVSSGNLGRIADDLGDYVTTEAHLKETLAWFRKTQDKPGMAMMLYILGKIDISTHQGRGDRVRAAG